MPPTPGQTRRQPACEPGDVLVVPLPDGRFGAVRVLAHDLVAASRGRYLVATTPYLEAEPPVADDPRLRQILRRESFQWSGAPATIWYVGPPPSHLRLLVNIPVEASELGSTDCFGSDWADQTHDEALREWRWTHDREAYEAEVRAAMDAAQARYQASLRRQKPKARLATEDFWSLIDLLGRPATDPEAQDQGLERLVEALSHWTRTDIKRFAESLAEHLYRLDTRAHGEASDNSDDGFLYARCGVVAEGRERYEAILANASQFPADAEFEFESLLYAAGMAYERKTGDELEYDTGYCYETGSNLDGWPDAG
jgi:hypothetical protein